MRLINTDTGKFENFTDASKAPLYAILSHTWDRPPGHELTYQDVVKIQEKCGLLAPSDVDPNDARPASQSKVEGAPSSLSIPTRPSIWDLSSGLSKKIRNACRVARNDGYSYIWVDSCCIDKSSSSELSEAINSMFNWYRSAQICYAFLSDVPSDDDVRAKGCDMSSDDDSQLGDEENAKTYTFRKSRWFKRAWTLQELIAPRVVVFLSQDWEGLGTKHSLADLIEEITHIDHDVLTHKRALADESVAERMRWASSRKATRVEDEAYALFGIFGITMTTIYGEGRHAFQRLQEAILQQIPDRTLFAWSTDIGITNPIDVDVQNTNSMEFKPFVSDIMVSPFATCPRSFHNLGGKIKALSTRDFDSLQLPIEEYAPTPHGIRTKICLIPLKSLAPNFQIWHNSNHGYIPSAEPWYLILLGLQQDNDNENQYHLLGKLCRINGGKSHIQLLEVPDMLGRFTCMDTPSVTWPNSTLIWADFRADLQSLTKDPIDVYLRPPAHSMMEREPATHKPNQDQATTILKFSPWASHAMSPHYTISEYTSSSLLHKEDLSIQGMFPPPLSLLLSSDMREPVTKLLIQYRHMPYIADTTLEGDQETAQQTKLGALIEARIWILSPDTIFNSDITPYTSAVWGAGEEAYILPIWYVSIPATRSGDETGTWITLRLWLGIAKYGYYHAHVEVAADHDDHDCTQVEMPAADASRTFGSKFKVFADQIPNGGEYGSDTESITGIDDQVMSRRQMLFPLENTLLRVPEPHPEFRLTMLGPVKRALEAQGCSVHLDSMPGGNTGNSNSHSLIISNSTFTISIRYFHNRYTPPKKRFPQFIVSACVTLEFHSDHSLQGFQDGPYVARWMDCHIHSGCFGPTLSYIYLKTPTEELLLTLELDRAWVSEYYLVVDLKRNHSRSQTADKRRDYAREAIPFLLVDPHDHICLVLPTHIRRALQLAGYEVSFEGSKNNPYHLTLSDSDNDRVTITIEYSYNLSINESSGRQQLMFQACVETSALQSSQDAANEPQTVSWNAWGRNPSYRPGYNIEKEGWLWHLRKEDVKLTLPSGLEMTLRLSLYIVWLSEYCITIEVNPASPLSPTGRDDRTDREGDDEKDSESDEVDIQVRRSWDMQEAAVSEMVDEENRDSDVVATVVSLPEPSAEDIEIEGAASEQAA